jgi:hypothetical protein
VHTKLKVSSMCDEASMSSSLLSVVGLAIPSLPT